MQQFHLVTHMSRIGIAECNGRRVWGQKTNIPHMSSETCQKVSWTGLVWISQGHNRLLVMV